ncbi:MAG: sigma-70 family RNA polymerase sigma factor [Pseudomonadota bacterium]
MDDLPAFHATYEDTAQTVEHVSAQQTEPSTKRQSDHNDITALYRDHSAELIASLRKAFGAGPPDPEDVAQQAFQKLIEREDRSDIRDLKAFLWRTARNTFLKAVSKNGVRSRHDFEVEHLFFPARGDDSTPERVLEVKEELKAINEVLRQMPEKRRHAFLLHKVEGLSVAAVARRLGISRTPAQKHITRAAHQIEVHLTEMQKGEQCETGG